jgi:hypothetical protein
MDGGFATERRTAAFGSTAARLMKAYAMQMEVLRRLRIGGQQFIMGRLAKQAPEPRKSSK